MQIFSSILISLSFCVFICYTNMCVGTTSGCHSWGSGAYFNEMVSLTCLEWAKEDRFAAASLRYLPASASLNLGSFVQHQAQLCFPWVLWVELRSLCLQRSAWLTETWLQFILDALLNMPQIKGFEIHLPLSMCSTALRVCTERTSSCDQNLSSVTSKYVTTYLTENKDYRGIKMKIGYLIFLPCISDSWIIIHWPLEQPFPMLSLTVSLYCLFCRKDLRFLKTKSVYTTSLLEK